MTGGWGLKLSSGRFRGEGSHNRFPFSENDTPSNDAPLFDPRKQGMTARFRFLNVSFSPIGRCAAWCRADTERRKTMEDNRLLDVAAVAELLGISERGVWRFREAGRMPAPVTLGRLVRWRSTDLTAWIAAGCPDCARTAARFPWRDYLSRVDWWGLLGMVMAGASDERDGCAGMWLLAAIKLIHRVAEDTCRRGRTGEP